ncbi:hypothetical protein EYR40_008473 [Pleurotus pulmonarius]|nr:hypothetical protein EYR36_009291 [Pleurotus pulmonarius]KAF4592789.1 hypothetical protein EYR38_008491 [Pleurotus pulmonarius]KAF4593683.1 hypothetical protein EYR40_008473 [Pleurotus pulmonarius]
MAKSSHIARQRHSMREARKLQEIVARQRTGLIPGDGVVPGDDAPVRPVTTTTSRPVASTTTTLVRVVTTASTTTPVVRVTVRPTTSPTVVVSPASTSSPVPVRSTTPARVLPSSSSLAPASPVVTSSKPKARATNTSSSASISASASALPSESGSTNSTGALAGGVIGGIALLALLSFGIVYYMRRFQKRKQNIAFEASAFRRSAILLDDSKSETKANGASSPMQEKHLSPTEHPFAPQFQFPTKSTNPSVYSGTGYDQQGYPGGQGNHVRLDTALPPPPVATSASPWGTAALVSAAAYGNSAYGMNSAPSPYSPYSQKRTQPDHQPPPSPMSAISYLPNPYADNERDNTHTAQSLSRQPSPPSTVMVRERERESQPPPSPVYGMHGQYVDLTRGSPLPPPTISKPPTIRRKFFVQNPTPEPEETPSPSSPSPPSSQPWNNAQQAVGTDRKRPDTVYSTIYNPEDAYGGF